MFKVIGLREEKYIGQVVSGHNCDFEYTDEELTRHVFLLKGVDGSKVELTLEDVFGECGSGWCTATYGEFKWIVVDNFAGKTHTINRDVVLDIDEGCLNTGEGSLDTEVFSFSELGGCCYYPSGGYSVNIDYFTPIKTLPSEHRLVHIFYGGSNLGKSHIAALTGKTVFETDSVSSLDEVPQTLPHDIIVIGNRWKCSVADIQERIITPCSIVSVSFDMAKM